MAAILLVVGTIAVVVPTIAHWGDTFGAKPVGAQTSTSTEAELDARGRVVSRHRTTRPVDSDVVTRVLDTGGIVLIRLLLVMLVAFVGGALLQRALLGRFGVTVGPLALPEIQETIATSETLASHLAALQSEAAAQRKEAASALIRAAESAEQVATLSHRLAQLQRDVAALQATR